MVPSRGEKCNCAPGIGVAIFTHSLKPASLKRGCDHGFGGGEFLGGSHYGSFMLPSAHPRQAMDGIKHKGKQCPGGKKAQDCSLARTNYQSVQMYAFRGIIHHKPFPF